MSISKPIPFDELSPEVQAVIRKNYDIRDPENQEATVAAATSSKQRKRKQTGDNFEAELDVTHAYYEYQKWGNIRRNYVPTKVVGAPVRGVQKRVVLGPAHVDRTGWLSVDAGYPGSGAEWRGIPWNSHLATQQIVPVAFDAKVLGLEHATYQHETDKQHQLHDMKAAAERGEYAFLLVLARQVSRIFAIAIQEHFTALLSGKGVPLYGRGRDMLHGGDAIYTHVPCVEKQNQAIGWDYIPLLAHCAPR